MALAGFSIKLTKGFSLLAILLGLGACSTSICRKASLEKKPEAATTQEKRQKQARRIEVYKYDGSKQCQKGSGTSLEKMAEQLKEIKIYASEKRSDGMMRPQVCGTETGQANVYEISKKNLKKAKEKGFQVWKFDE